jgi:magnesium chelatase subunit I
MMIKSYSSLVRHPDNAALFKAIEMSVLAAQQGQPLHIHAEGLRGTGKTTILRSARTVLPKIERVTGCLYNCDPKAPHCPQHRNMDYAELARLGTERIPMPFLEISHSAKVATVAGGVDLERLTNKQHPEAALLPGTLAQAHRGIVFVDEVNRLADTSPELADILLDVMGTKPGRLQIEDAGLPKIEIASLVTVWAASNPDEDPGPLEGIRRQLADRFDLCIGVRRPSSFSTVMAILRQAGTAEISLLDPEEMLTVSTRLSGAMHRLTELSLTESQMSFLAHTYLDYNLESLRALEAITAGARMHASLAGKQAVDVDDLRTVIPMALKHRTPPHVLSDILDALNRWAEAEAATSPAQVEPPPEDEQPEPELPAAADEESYTSNRYNFLSRLFGSLRDRQEEPKNIGAANLQPEGDRTPLQRDSVKQGAFSAAPANPDVVTITAPPNPAKSVKEVPEARLIMTEEALRRDH